MSVYQYGIPKKHIGNQISKIPLKLNCKLLWLSFKNFWTMYLRLIWCWQLFFIYVNIILWYERNNLIWGVIPYLQIEIYIALYCRFRFKKEHSGKKRISKKFQTIKSRDKGLLHKEKVVYNKVYISSLFSML